MTDAGLTRNKAVVADMIEAVWRGGDLDALPAYWTPDCLNHADAGADPSGLPRLRAYHEGFRRAFAGYSGFTIVILRQIAEGDEVVTQIAARATHIATGKPILLASMRIDRLRDGKIAEHWSVADMAALARQLAA